jgi:hypothetical protein
MTTPAPSYLTIAQLPLADATGEIHHIATTWVMRAAWDLRVFAAPGDHVVGSRTGARQQVGVFDPSACPVCLQQVIDAGGVHLAATATAGTACGNPPSPQRPIVDADPRFTTCPDCLAATGSERHPASIVGDPEWEQQTY